MRNPQPSITTTVCIWQSRPAHISLILVSFLGALCLISGLCIVLIWANVASFPSNHPSGLKVGSSLTAIGGLFLLFSIVILYRWQTRFRRQTSRQQPLLSEGQAHNGQLGRKIAHVYQVKLPKSDTLDAGDTDSDGGTLKKAKSAVYISFESVSQEKFKLLGLLHGGTLSTASVNELSLETAKLHKQEMTGRLGHFTDLTGPCLTSHRYIRSTNQRDKSSRRSLPRVLVRASVKMSQPNASSDLESDHLSKAKSEGQVQSKPIELNPLLTKTHESDVNPSGISTKPNRNTTPPKVATGQASLFNLDNSYGGCNTTESSVHLTHPLSGEIPPPGSTADQTNGGGSGNNRRYLLMKNTGQMISCTTLFGMGEDNELDAEHSVVGDHSISADPASMIGQRQLQACSGGGWNFFPVFIEPPLDNPTLTDDEPGDERAEPHSGAVENNKKSVRWIDRLRGYLKFRLSKRTKTTGCIGALHSPTVFIDQFDGQSEQSNNSHQQSANRRPEYSFATYEGGDVSSADGLTEDGPFHKQSMHEVAVANRKHTVTSNASVFSLPAIPLELWTADKPVWIMGVPVEENQWVAVDAPCDLILLEREDRAGSANRVLKSSEKAPTGSTSSIFAFHVKPPSRLMAPTRIGRIRYGRARSLGRILSPDKRFA